MDELFEKTLESLDWPYLRARLASYAGSGVGRERIEALEFVDSPEEVDRLLTQTTEVRKLLDAGTTVPIGGIREIRTGLESVAKGELLSGRELLDVATTLQACEHLKRFFADRAEECTRTQAAATRMNDLQQLASLLSNSFESSGELSLSMYPELARLRNQIHSLHSRIESKLNAILGSGELSSLVQDSYVTMRGDRYVIPLKVQARSMDLGIVHDASGSGQTVFVEPRQVIPINNELKLAEAEYRREERRILVELSRQVASEFDRIHKNLRVAAELEFIHARARLSQDLQATHPVVVKEAYLRLHEVRHPVLVLRGLDVVANDLSIGRDFQALVLSGPNTGGKTVALKALGLCALMTRAGLHIPAKKGSEVGLFETVLTDIGDQQTVELDLSTFSGHILGIKRILEAVGEDGARALVLLDEIAVGTDPAQGAALARALLESFVDSGAKLLVTTHYSELKTLSVQDRRFANGRVEYDSVGLKPTYRVVIGTPGRSYAFDIAEKLGVGRDLVQKARTYLAGGQVAMEDLLGELESALGRARDEKTLLERAKKESESLRQKYEAQLREVKEEADQLRIKAMADFEKELKAARQQISDVVRAMQRGKGGEVITASTARDKISEVSRRVREKAPKAPVDEKLIATPLGPGELRVGARVLVANLKREGIVQSLPEVSGGLVEVLVRGLRVKVWPTDLRRPISKTPAVLPHKRLSKGKQKKAKRTSPGAQQTSFGQLISGGLRGVEEAPRVAEQVGIRDDILEHAFQTSTNTVDLRGLRVDDGLDQMDRFLDKASLQGEQVVIVVHGHGTGAMRSAVRSYLKTSAYVQRFQPGAQGQGGDGATIVALK